MSVSPPKKSEHGALKKSYTLPAMKVDRRNVCACRESLATPPGVDAEKATRGKVHISWPNH